ncbi:dehydrogenase/reductase SDR family member 11 isoform X2 [Bemisia tabaci]|nr:PREDICTED: dehydrogenase/reductase SDR family member 11-like [Bemisia tabaci]
MDKWQGRNAMITGANSGIGAAVTRKLLKLGLNVIGVDKNTDMLQEMKDDIKSAGELYPRSVELQNEEEIMEAFRWTEETLGGVDVMINCAGVGGRASLLDGTVDEWKKLMDVNVIALSICTKEAIDSMRKRNVDGHIIHLSSFTAHHVPNFAPLHFYCATKHAVRALTEGLRQELKAINSPIKVTCLSPGLVKSAIFKSSLGYDFDEFLYSSRPCIQPEDVASTIEFVLSTPPHVQIQDIIVKPLGSDV